jgi:hypothetical protein
MACCSKWTRIFTDNLQSPQMLKRMVSGLAPGWVTFENVHFKTLEIFSQLQTLIDFFSLFSVDRFLNFLHILLDFERRYVLWTV